MRLGPHSFIPILCAAITTAQAQVTVYRQNPFETVTADNAVYTGLAAYDPTILIPPPVPDPSIPKQFAVQVTNGGVPGLSIRQHGGFFGFSIEMSVVNQVCESVSTSAIISCS
jgi:hypothetical protein